MTVLTCLGTAVLQGLLYVLTTLLPTYQSIWSHIPKENTLQSVEGASNLNVGIADDLYLILSEGYECV